jgi:hypothetical protein
MHCEDGFAPSEIPQLQDSLPCLSVKERMSKPIPDDDAEALRETLGALEMPPEALRKWFRQSQAFCNAHGGKRHYAELLALYDECLGMLDEREPGER